MTKDKQDIPFFTVLDRLFGDDQVSVPLLYRLSDMSPAEMADFTRRWPEVADERRRVIVRHLADIAEENYVVDFAPIFQRCFTDPFPAVRVAALDGIWDESNLRLVDRIIELLRHDKAAEVRSAAASALAHYVLMAEWGEIPRTATPRIVSALLQEYERPGTAVSVKRAALEALGAVNHPRVMGLIDTAYQSDDPEIRLSAVFAMGSNADERWLPIVLREMKSPHTEMRIEAARAAGNIGHPDALPGLIHLAVDPDLEVGLAVVEALGRIGSDKAYQILTHMAEDADFSRLHEAIDEILEEIDLMSGKFDLWQDVSDMTDDDDEDELAGLDLD